MLSSTTATLLSRICANARAAEGGGKGGKGASTTGMPKPPPRPSPEYPEGRHRRDITGESIEGEEVLSHASYLAAQGGIGVRGIAIK